MFDPKFHITPAISVALMQIEAIRQELSWLVIHPELLVSSRETATLTSTHFSTQIEGNRLTLPEVKAVIKGAKFPGRERHEREVRNHFLAFEFMEKLSVSVAELRETEIQQLHSLVMNGKSKASAYRVQQNVIRDSASGQIVYLPPEAVDVQKLMQELVAWVNAALASGDLPVPIIAGLSPNSLCRCQLAHVSMMQLRYDQAQSNCFSLSSTTGNVIAGKSRERG